MQRNREVALTAWYPTRMKCLELFAGIGGFAAAFPGIEIIQAVDIDQVAAKTYSRNFSHPYKVAEITSLSEKWFDEQEADFWWMSPPCTPFSRRGNFTDLRDPRCQALRYLIDVVPEVRPKYVAIENVVGFESSEAFDSLSHTWRSAGYQVHWVIACPSQMGLPNRRPRFFAIASFDFDVSLGSLKQLTSDQPLSRFIEHNRIPSKDLDVSEDLVQQYSRAIDIVDSDHPDACTTCFTSAYGRSIVRSGSYLRWHGGYRRFSPREVARLLGFPEWFSFPEDIPTKRLWHLLGNSLSIPCVQSVFSDVLTRTTERR
ncbi:MAG: DNA cytosine methyltransferase [Planctomycetes bacterium]|nr:DNA cytosine methyltransferase [Planctomycetota bacterium]